MPRKRESLESVKDRLIREQQARTNRRIRHNKDINLSLQQIQDCKEGPVGERAVGVTIAKTFDGIEFKGTIDSFRQF
jgi:hypothetical protein